MELDELLNAHTPHEFLSCVAQVAREKCCPCKAVLNTDSGKYACSIEESVKAYTKHSPEKALLFRSEIMDDLLVFHGVTDLSPRQLVWITSIIAATLNHKKPQLAVI